MDNLAVNFGTYKAFCSGVSSSHRTDDGYWTDRFAMHNAAKYRKAA